MAQALGKVVGFACPYCRFPLKGGSEVRECAACHAVHHAECFLENGECAVTGCGGAATDHGTDTAPQPRVPSPPLHQVTASAAVVPAPARFGPPTGEPARPPRNPWKASFVGLCLLLALGGAGAAIAIALTGHPQVKVTSASATRHVVPVSSNPGPTAPQTPSPTPTPAAGSAQTDAFVWPHDHPVTGQDSNGYNVGTGCSDDQASTLPGCDDSPSVPSGEPGKTCGSGVTVDPYTTTCGLADDVRANYRADGSVAAYSRLRGRDYTFACRTAGPGTTGYIVCLGRAGSAQLYARWHP